MQKKITWSQHMKRLDLYDACWIMGNIPERAKLIEEHPIWSLLPIRYYNFGMWEYIENYRPSSRRFENGIEIYRSANICSSLAHFARMLWEKAAEVIAMEFSEIMNIQYGAQGEDGIYPITFRYNFTDVLTAQRRIMRDLIKNGFSVDEYLTEKTREQSARAIVIHYEGVLDYSCDDLSRIFHEAALAESLPVTIRKKVQFTYEECEEYYKTFDERMLVLGNQRRAYRFFEPYNHDLFEAAKAGDKDALIRFVNEGRSLNEIAPCGDTAFSLLLQHMIHIQEKEICDITDEDEQFLDCLWNYGVNVNLIGVDECADPPLFISVIRHTERLTNWLLSHGADTNAEVVYDDCFGNGSNNTIQGWIDEENYD